MTRKNRPETSVLLTERFANVRQLFIGSEMNGFIERVSLLFITVYLSHKVFDISPPENIFKSLF